MAVGGRGPKPRQRRPRRPHQAVQGDPAQALLRHPRLGAVRSHLLAARVLPDPHRAVDPRRARARRSSTRPARPSSSSWAPARPTRPGSCSTRWPPRGRSSATSRSTSPSRSCATLPQQLVQEYDGLHVHGVVGDFERHLERVPPTSRRCAHRGPARRHCRQLPAGHPAALPAQGPRAARTRRPAAARDRPGQGSGGDRGRLRRPRGRHRRVQPQRPARHQPRARRRLRARGVRPHRVLRSPARVGRDAPARAAAPAA